METITVQAPLTGETDPAWVRLGKLVACSEARQVVSDPPMKNMVHALFRVLQPHLQGAAQTADVPLPELSAAGVENLMVFRWLMSLMPSGFGQPVAIDAQGRTHVGEDVVRMLESLGQGFLAFYRFDLAALRACGRRGA